MKKIRLILKNPNDYIYCHDFSIENNFICNPQTIQNLLESYEYGDKMVLGWTVYEDEETNKDEVLNSATVYKFVNLERYLVFYCDNKIKNFTTCYGFILVHEDGKIIKMKTEKIEVYRDGGTTFAKISGYDNRLIDFYKPSAFNKDPLKKATFDQMVLDKVEKTDIISTIKDKVYNIL